MSLRERLNKVLGHALVVIMSIMVVNVLWQVFSRYVLGMPSSFTEELARFLMIWLGVLGAAFVAGGNGHVAIDTLVKRGGQRTQKRLKLAVRIAIISFCFFAMVVGGFRLVYITYMLEQYSPALGLPLGVVYLVIPIGGFLIISYKISDMLTD